MEKIPDILTQVIERRKAKGLYVRRKKDNGDYFHYYPATEAQKNDFMRRAKNADMRKTRPLT